jgi:hypothetical protein
MAGHATARGRIYRSSSRTIPQHRRCQRRRRLFETVYVSGLALDSTKISSRKMGIVTEWASQLPPAPAPGLDRIALGWLLWPVPAAATESSG